MDADISADVVADWQKLVTRPDLDIIWVGARPDLHEPTVVAALAAGKHVFCQARMARDLREARRMFEASERRPDLVTMLCPPPYGLEADAFIRDVLAGLPGPVRQLHLESLNGQFLDPTAPAHWRQRREISGKNVMTLGIYTEVLQRWFGDIREVRATGRIRTPVRAGYKVTIPEELSVTADFASGIPARLDFSNIHDGPATERLTVDYEGGSVVFDFLSNEIVRTTGSVRDVLVPPPSSLRPWQVERDFISAVENPDAPRPHPTFRDGISYMRVVDAVEEARLSGNCVRLELPN